MLPEVKLAGNAEANVELKAQVNVEPFAMAPKPFAVSWAPVPPVNSPQTALGSPPPHPLALRLLKANVQLPVLVGVLAVNVVNPIVVGFTFGSVRSH